MTTQTTSQVSKKTASQRKFHPNKIVTVLVRGYSSFGREVLRGVFDYVQRYASHWRLQIELNPYPLNHEEGWQMSDGFIFSIPNEAILRQIMASGKPIINTLAHYESFGLATVTVDDYAIGKMAADHFIQKGFEHFAFYAAGDHSKAATLRYHGFKDALATRRREVPKHLETNFNKHYSGGRLKEIGFPLALFCAHDVLARSLMTKLIFDGISIPNDVSILGVDNDRLHCQIAEPPLSSIELPYRKLGFDAAERLDALINDVKIKQRILHAPMGVIERQSTELLAIQDPALQKAITYVKEHACDPCNVKEVVAHSGLSRRALESLFKEHVHLTPHQAITAIRMDKAKRLLRETREPIVIVAERCGYELVQNFGRAFQQINGETPGSYRKRLQNLEATS